MPAYDDAKFRVLFPFFNDEEEYPSATITMWWQIACEYINPVDSCWRMLRGSSLQLALDLMCAHLLALSTNAIADSEDGGTTGAPVGVETSASIGAVSVSTLPPPVGDAWEYWMNSTAFGQQLLALLKVKSVGGLYIGGLPERRGFRKVGGVFL